MEPVRWREWWIPPGTVGPSLTPVAGFQEAAAHADHCGRHHDPDGQAEWRWASGGVCHQPLWTLHDGEASCENWTLSLMFGVGRGGSGQDRSHRFRC